MAAAAPEESTEIDSTVSAELNPLRLESCSLFLITPAPGKRNTPFPVHDPMPGETAFRAPCVQYPHNLSRGPGVAGHRGDLPVGRNKSFRYGRHERRDALRE